MRIQLKNEQEFKYRRKIHEIQPYVYMHSKETDFKKVYSHAYTYAFFLYESLIPWSDNVSHSFLPGANKAPLFLRPFDLKVAFIIAFQSRIIFTIEMQKGGTGHFHWYKRIVGVSKVHVT